MEGVHDNASAFMRRNKKTSSLWLKLTSHLCQKATFLDFMEMPENESTLFRE